MAFLICLCTEILVDISYQETLQICVTCMYELLFMKHYTCMVYMYRLNHRWMMPLSLWISYVSKCTLIMPICDSSFQDNEFELKPVLPKSQFSMFGFLPLVDGCLVPINNGLIAVSHLFKKMTNYKQTWFDANSDELVRDGVISLVISVINLFQNWLLLLKIEPLCMYLYVGRCRHIRNSSCGFWYVCHIMSINFIIWAHQIVLV